MIGVGVLLVVFAGVLFPLWPMFMRQGAYYVSLGSMGFLGFLIALGVFRYVIWFFHINFQAVLINYYSTNGLALS
jgi:translocation protein SEC62